MARVKLTQGRVQGFECPAERGQAFLWDSEAPGLAVRATRSAQAYVWQGKLRGRDVRITLGSVAAWTLEDARRQARELQRMVDQGKDPRDLKRSEAEKHAATLAAEAAAQKERAEAGKWTLRRLCSTYCDHLTARGKGRSAADAESLFRCHLPDDVADLPAREVASRQLAEAVRKVVEANKERTAGKMRSYLFAAYKAAQRAPYDARLPADFIGFAVESNPVEPLPPIEVKAGHRTLDDAELREYLGRLTDAAADRLLLVALLAGGQRLQQLGRATLADFNAQAGTLRLWDAKGKRKEPREHVLPLGARALAEVEQLAAQARERGSEHLFSHSGRVPVRLETISKRVTEIAKAMAGKPFQGRDLRRTCETMLAAMGISRDVRAQLLSHGLGGVQQAHYDRHSYMDEKRAALEAWEGRIAAIEKGETAPANVRPLRKSVTAA